MAHGIPPMEDSRVAMVLLTLVIATWVGCSKDSTNPAGNTPPSSPSRILSISASPRQDPPATTQDILAAIDLAYNSGARGQHLNATWRSLEPSPSAFSLTNAANTLAYLGTFRGFKLQVVLSVLNTNVRETPTDLMNVPFDSPQMMGRFHAMLDAILPLLNPNVVYFSMGNEVDVYLSLHPAEWPAYKSFYQDAVSYLHQRAPSLKLGVTTTYSGANGIDSLNVRHLNDSSDVFILTYYPIGNQFAPRQPSVVATEIAQMISLAQGRPLILQEVGYPTATSLGSSEQAQAQFVANVFGAWQTHGTAIPFLNFFCMHDFTRGQCDSLAQYYGSPSNQPFKDFLGSLGFRAVNGTPRMAWQAFVDSASRISKRQE